VVQPVGRVQVILGQLSPQGIMGLATEMKGCSCYDGIPSFVTRKISNLRMNQGCTDYRSHASL
jgi:hypothetical protein